MFMRFMKEALRIVLLLTTELKKSRRNLGEKDKIFEKKSEIFIGFIVRNFRFYQTIKSLKKIILIALYSRYCILKCLKIKKHKLT